MKPILDAAPVAVFCYRITAARFSYVNAKFARELGYTREEILALGSVTDIIADDNKDVVNEMIRRRERGDDHEVRYVTKVRCRDGTLVETEVHSVVADVGGERVVIGTAVDMTSHLTAHRQLRDYEEYFRALTENAADVIEVVGRDGLVTYISPSVERVLGFAADDHLGRLPLDTIHPEDRPALTGALEKLARGASSVGPEEYRVRHKSGAWRVMEVMVTNLTRHPQIRGLVMNLRDVTDRNRMQNELAQLNRLTSLGRLASQVAHEFNNVLMGVQSVTEAIRRNAGDDVQLRRFSDVILASIARGKRVAADILRFARPAQPTLRLVNVQDFVRQAADEIRHILPQRIQLDLDVDATPMLVQADTAQLAQILVNLSLNARDAMEEDGRLTIGVRGARPGEIAGAEAFIHLTVTDTGTGIAEEDVAYIFEPLFTTKRSGTGLGLSVVFQIIAAHGGHISVESEPGKGSTFHLFLPSAAAASPEEEQPEVVEDRRLPRSLRVLIVEDDESVAAGLQWTLEAEGMAVRVVGRGADVMPAIGEFQPDVMVLDLSLPDESGQSVYERVASVSPLPVIFSSGHASESEIERLVGHTRTVFLMKPYAGRELLCAIRRLVAERESL